MPHRPSVKQNGITGKMQNRRFLLLEFAVLISLMNTAVILILGIGFYSYSNNLLRKNLEKSSVTAAQEIITVLEEPLYSISDSMVKSIAEAYFSSGTLEGIRVESYATGVLSVHEPKNKDSIGPYYFAVFKNDIPLGNVTLWFSTREVRELQKQLLYATGTITIGTLAMVFFIIFIVVRIRLSSTLQNAITGIKEFSDGNFRFRIPDSRYYEIHNIVTLLNSMSINILEKETVLKSLNQTLEDKVEKRTEELKKTSERLRIAERMMALGTLVTGISHELNTPLGISLTAVTHLENRLSRFSADGDEYRAVKDAIELIRNNLDRAIHLIMEFKSIVADDNTKNPETFSLDSVIEKSIQAIKPEMDKKKITVEFHPAGVRCSSHKDAIWPIITNLILNAANHAYADGGTIRMETARKDDMNCIAYKDFGSGMTEKVINKIFEPFFTTARGKAGGTGIGMYIVYNMVTDRLRGKIDISSAPGKGTEISIAFPDLQ